MAGSENAMELAGFLRPLKNAEGEAAAVSVEVEGLECAPGFEQRREPDEAVN